MDEKKTYKTPDEELAEILREREKSVNWVSHEEVMAICAKLGYV